MHHLNIRNLIRTLPIVLGQKRHRTARITAAIVLVFGVAFSLTAPPLWGLDEVAHFNRVLEISDGHIIPKKDARGTVNYIPSNLRALEYTVYMDLSDNKITDLFSGRKDVSYGSSYKILDAQKFSRTLEASPITAAYSPFAYVGPLIGVFAAKLFGVTIGTTIFLARLGGLLSYAALIYLAVALLDKYRTKMLIAVIALLPISVFQASTINADTLSIGISLFFISLIFRLVLDTSEKAVSKKMLIGLSTAAVLLPLIKINNIVLLPLILLISQSIFTTKVRAIFYKVASIILPALAVIVWTILVPIATNTNSLSPRQDGLLVNEIAQLHLLFSHPLYLIKAIIVSTIEQSDRYLGTMTTTLGWNVATLPSILTLFSVVLLVIASLYVKNDFKSRKAVKLVAFVVGVVATTSVFAAMYVAFNPVGFSRVDGVQGRYFIPYLPLLLCGLAWIPLDVAFAKNNASRLFIGSTVVLLVVCYVCYRLILY